MKINEQKRTQDMKVKMYLLSYFLYERKFSIYMEYTNSRII